MAHLTDVEGNLRYFERWLATTARIVRYDKLELAHANAYCVDGDDVVDKGTSGNRDLNTFERRRQEVVLLRGDNDDKVASSFVAEAAAAARCASALREYPRVGVALPALLGITLFVHSAVDVHSMGLVVPADGTHFEMPDVPSSRPLEDMQFEERFVRCDHVTRGVARVVALNTLLCPSTDRSSVAV